MKNTYTAFIRFTALMLLTVTLLGTMLTGCAENNEGSNAQSTVKNDPATNDVQQTTAPIAEDPDPIETSPCNPTEPVDDVHPTEPVETDPSTEPAETIPPTGPDDPTEPSSPTEPEATQPPAEEGSGVTYLEYYAMSAEQQQAFIDSFDSLDAFFAWHTAAKEEYESGRTPIDGGTLNP